MTPNPTPAEGQVYHSLGGRAALYVREETRSGGRGRERLLIETHDGVVFHRWLPIAAPFPEPYELVLDPDATARADRLALELRSTGAQRDALTEALKRAVVVVPVAVANDLRRIYREALGGPFVGANQ